MARVRVRIEVCDRCPEGRQLPATTTVRLSIDGEKPAKRSLCDDCAEAVQRFFCGTLPAPPVADEPAQLVPRSEGAFGYAEDRRRTAELRAKQWEADRLAAMPKVAVRTDRRPTFNWSLTDHARERAEQRGYDVQDVLTAAAFPELRWRHPHDDEKWLHRRGPILVIVNPDEQAVISVLHRDEKDYARTDPDEYQRRQYASVR